MSAARSDRGEPTPPSVRQSPSIDRRFEQSGDATGSSGHRPRTSPCWGQSPVIQVRPETPVLAGRGAGVACGGLGWRAYSPGDCRVTQRHAGLVSAPAGAVRAPPTVPTGRPSVGHISARGSRPGVDRFWRLTDIHGRRGWYFYRRPRLDTARRSPVRSERLTDRPADDRRTERSGAPPSARRTRLLPAVTVGRRRLVQRCRPAPASTPTVSAQTATPDSGLPPSSRRHASVGRRKSRQFS